MRREDCEPGSVIVAGSAGKFPHDWVIGYAKSVEKRWGQTTVTDVSGRRWKDVGVLPPGSFEIVEAVHGRVRYPAARPVGPVSRVPELAHTAIDLPTGARGRVRAASRVLAHEEGASTLPTHPLFHVEELGAPS